MRLSSSRWLAGLVLASFVGNQVLFAYEPERSFWEQRRQGKAKRSADPTASLLARGPSLSAGGGGAASLSPLEKGLSRSPYGSAVLIPTGLGESFRPYFSAVPLAHATVRKITLPENGKPRGLVFHILDVHRNLDAQTNIAHTVTSLIGSPEKSPISLVGLEGAFRPYDLSWLRSFPDPQGTRVAAEDLLAQDKMSGPIFSLLTSPKEIPPVVGVDDELHYQANISAYRRSLPTKESDQARIKNRIDELALRKETVFNDDLKAFDKTVQGYHRATVSLGAYARALDRKGAPPLDKSIALFLQAVGLEETLDFKLIEQQRVLLLESLSQKMNPTQTNELISRSVAYRAGQLSYGDFYRWIETLCREVGVPMSRFPAMADYVRYVLLSEAIDAEDLLGECRRREKTLYALLAKPGEERDLVAQTHNLMLIEKLVDFSLTPDEWSEYEQIRGRAEVGIELDPYESFYREAHARDGAMAENFLGDLEKLSRSETSAGSVSIIVTGGYHGPGLNEKLVRAGMAVVTVVPKIEKVDTAQGSSYLTVFAQEKTPLDKLFEGAKLFVADSPLSAQNAAFQAVGAAAASTQPGTPFPQKVLAFLESHFDGVTVRWTNGVAHIRLLVLGKEFLVRYDPSQSAGKKSQPDETSTGTLLPTWIQNLRSQAVDGRLFITGTALAIAGVWIFFTGTGLVEKIGPFLTMIGTITILQSWAAGPGGKSHVANSSMAPPVSQAAPVNQPVAMMQVGADQERHHGASVHSGEKGYVNLSVDRNFWIRIMENPANKGFVFYFDKKSGEYEVYSRENHPGDLAVDPNDEISELFRIQHRVNVPWGAKVDQDGNPETSHFFLTHADHKPLVIVFTKNENKPKVFEGYSADAKTAMETARFVVVHNPDRAKRPGRNAAQQTKEQAELNPGMKVLSPQYIFDHYPMEMWLTWTSPDGNRYLRTANLAGYIPNDPYGDPHNQVDHVTLSHASDTSQSQLIDPWAIRDSLNAFFGQKKLNREKFRVTGNGWYYGDFSAGASQNILHNHMVRLVLLIERAVRVPIAKAGEVTIGHLGDNEDARGLFFEIASENDLPKLVEALAIAYRKITQKGDSFNFIIAPNGANGARVFVGDKIAGVPEGQFPNPSAFAEFGLVFIVDDPTFAFNLTESQLEELSRTANVSEWVIQNWRDEKITLRDDLKDKCASSIDLVSQSKEEYKILAREVLAEINSPPALRLDSLLSRILSNKSSNAKTEFKKMFWKVAKHINDFVMAPIIETGLFFLLPAASGSIFLLAVGLLVFIGFHFLDDYYSEKSRGLSPLNAFYSALRTASARLPRVAVFYAGPFALFLGLSDLTQWFGDIGFLTSLSFVGEKSLIQIAAGVALLHSGRNLLNTFNFILLNRIPGLASRRDFPLLLTLFGIPSIAYASKMIVDPSRALLFLAGLPWVGILAAAAAVWGMFVLYRAGFLSGGSVSDEKEAVDHMLGSGLPHRVTGPLLLYVATHTENEEVARLAIHPLIAPWRNLNIDLQKAKSRFEEKGWQALAKEVSNDWESDVKWVGALAASDARHVADVVFLDQDPFLTGKQDASIKSLKEVFPSAKSLEIETMGSPGLNQIHNIGLDLGNPLYEGSFNESIKDYYRELQLSDGEDVSPIPTVNQSLGRLRKFADKGHKPGTDENKVPVQLEVYTLSDIETARQTIQLLKSVNEGQEYPVRLVLAGADQETVTALANAASGVANVTVVLSPVAVQAEAQGWNLDTSILNRQFQEIMESLNLGENFDLEVSLSETIAVDRNALDSQPANTLNEALKQALLRFILNEARPFHFNTMLKIILAIKQSA